MSRSAASRVRMGSPTPSTSCGRPTAGRRSRVLRSSTFTRYDAQDVPDPEAAPPPPAGEPREAGADEDAPSGTARDCGDFDAHCQSGYTFFRRDTQVRATANQFEKTNADRGYLVYAPTKPGTEVAPGTTYGSIEPGTGSQSGIFYAAWNGASGSFAIAPRLIDNQ